MAILDGNDNGNDNQQRPITMQDVTPDKTEPPFTTDYIKKGFGEGNLQTREDK